MNSYVGKTIGKYQIEGYIGRGAMAEVYKAYHPHLDRFVAIKLLHSFLAEQTDILDRFRREAMHVIALNHPNIVRVHDFDREGSNYYMVMELIEGITLKQLLKETQANGQLIPIHEVMRIVHDVATALNYAHQRDVIHRDVKPANVMIEHNTHRVILTDFGLSKITSGPQFTSSGAMVGTPAYISPEQGQGRPGDSRSDIYSLGVMFYQLATGKLPFSAETPLAVVFKHINAPLQSPRSLNPDIPTSVETIITKSLEKDPEKRYPTSEILIDELDNINVSEITGSNVKISTIDKSVFPDASSPVTISLHFLDNGQIIPLQGSNAYTLGRRDGDIDIEVDLTPYDGFRLGVSRAHSTIRIGTNNRVTISDMGSTNGTWLNGAKLVPNVPEAIHNGDIIALGKLMIQVLVHR